MKGKFLSEFMPEFLPEARPRTKTKTKTESAIVLPLFLAISVFIYFCIIGVVTVSDPGGTKNPFSALLSNAISIPVYVFLSLVFTISAKVPRFVPDPVPVTDPGWSAVPHPGIGVLGTAP